MKSEDEDFRKPADNRSGSEKGQSDGKTGMTPKPLLELEFRRIAAPARASEGAVVYALLPTLEDLLGAPGFGRRNPIMLADGHGVFDPWTFFHTGRVEFRLH